MNRSCNPLSIALLSDFGIKLGGGSWGAEIIWTKSKRTAVFPHETVPDHHSLKYVSLPTWGLNLPIRLYKHDATNARPQPTSTVKKTWRYQRGAPIDLLDVDYPALKTVQNLNFTLLIETWPSFSSRLKPALNWNWPFPGPSGRWSGGEGKRCRGFG